MRLPAGYLYDGHSLGLAGTIAVIAAVVLRVAWMYRGRGKRR